MPDPEPPVATTLSPQARMGLLGYITSTSLDEDYAHVAAVAAQRTGSPARNGNRRPGLVAILAFALFGILVATAGIQTARGASTEDSNRASLVAQVNDARDVLHDARDQLSELEAETSRARRTSTEARSDLTRAQGAYDEVAVVTGAGAATGPGLRLVANDAKTPLDETQRVLDTDLRDIVNGLWHAGAEAISVNGERLTALSAIAAAEGQILVNYHDVRAPYEVLAIGDPAQLEQGFNESTTGQAWLANKDAYGLRFSISRRGEVAVPAAPSARLQLRIAEAPSAKGKEDDE